MYCPNCGIYSHTEQSYCRTCGLNLAAVSETLVHQLPSASYASTLWKQRRLEKFGDFAWNSFALAIIVAIGALVYHVVSGVTVHFELFVIAIVGFAILCIVHRVLSQRAEERRSLRMVDALEAKVGSGEGTALLDRSRLGEADTQKLVH